MNAAVPPDTLTPASTAPATARAPAKPWRLSVVVPACNAAGTLTETLAALVQLPGGAPEEIIVVENGSGDGTWELLETLQKDWRAEPRLIALRSEKGIGSAYRAGVGASAGDRVLLTADDLPFGTSDVEAVLACRSLPRFAIGSKAHPRSRVRRTFPRRAASRIFRLARRLLIGLDVGDTQGTFVIEGNLARLIVADTTIPGFGMTTELVALAGRYGAAPVELPVVLRHRQGASRINWVADSTAMMLDLLRLRRRLSTYRRPPAVVLPDATHS
jgi:glycosyltransferase involved in cell wall biosynthesis